MSEGLERQLLWLLNVSRKMLATREIERVLELIADAFMEATQADHGYILLKDRKTGELELRCSRGVDRAPDPRVTQMAKKAFRDNVPILASAATDGDLSARRIMQDLNLNMMAFVPVATDQEVIGVLCADSDEEAPGQFDSTGRRVCALLATHAAAAIDNARMFERATNDPLTGLPNSSYFLLHLAKVMRQASETAATGILLLDLDAFKRINERAGAEMGDRALIDIASTLQETLRADGLVARYGSDKFAVLLPPEPGERIDLRLRDAAERARAAISTKTYHGINVTASIGGVSFPGPSVESAPDLVALADDVLARARARGAGQVEIV